MADVAKLKELLERVKAATGPDREIDEAVASALSVEEHFAQLADAPEGTGCMMYRLSEGDGIHSAYRVTSSIDAAVALVEKVLPGCNRIMRDGEPYRNPTCTLSPLREVGRVPVDGAGATLPLAILSALLRALISKAEEGEGR